MEEDNSKVPTHIKRTDKAGQSYVMSPEVSPTLAKGQTREVQSIRRPAKKAKKNSNDGKQSSESTVDEIPLLSDTLSLDRQAILKTIESMKTAMRHLKASIGLTEQELFSGIASIVCWDDIAHLLPSKEDCEMIIDCFFSDVSL